MAKEAYRCFELTSLFWDLNESRNGVYLKALRSKNPEAISEFLTTWNQARRYQKDTLKTILEQYQSTLEKRPTDLRSYLKLANGVLKKLTKKTNEEYIGSIKLSHIYHPDIFPLLDNPTYFLHRNFIGIVVLAGLISKWITNNEKSDHDFLLFLKLA